MAAQGIFFCETARCFPQPRARPVAQGLGIDNQGFSNPKPRLVGLWLPPRSMDIQDLRVLVFG